MDFKRNLKKLPERKLTWLKNLKHNTSMKKTNKKITSFSDHLDQQYGKKGTADRDRFEEGFEAFKLGVMIQELRKEQGLTQEQLAEKCGTTKTYISRIENNASDIRLSTLMRIIKEGLGGNLRLSVDI
jgi:HTH-type transcriptional regulator / antitoxin HipB